MADTSDPVELAVEIAKIASKTTDPDTALQLGDLMDRLLTEAGLPPLFRGGWANLNSPISGNPA